MIKDLKDIRREEINLFGGKAANLGFLIQNGFSVPRGFCISTKIKKIDNKFKAKIISKFRGLKSKVAVRSSATAEDSKNFSFAGQFDTFLNIDSEAKLLNAIDKCRKSVNSARALSYLKNKNIGNIGMGVLVQKMINPDYAGVIFTVDPVGKKYILIEIVKGLGDKLVSGNATPNNYFIHRKNMDIKKKSEMFKINSEIIGNLAKTASGIELIYNFPQDIEFAVKEDKIFILQSRPITTL